jgi:hypothetical protein
MLLTWAHQEIARDLAAIAGRHIDGADEKWLRSESGAIVATVGDGASLIDAACGASGE